MDVSATSPVPHSIAGLRHRDGRHARVSFEELFFDLVYVFAVTQLAHLLLHHLSWTGALETLILWFAVWLGWQYTSWMTNWFDPETPRIRALLFSNMLPALLTSTELARRERARWVRSSFVAFCPSSSLQENCDHALERFD